MMHVDKVYLESTLDREILSLEYFSKGQIGTIYKVITEDSQYVLKTSQTSSQFQVEADMLKDINKYNIHVPQVFDVSKSTLLMECIEEEEISIDDKELQAAELLSTLHTVSNESRMYGYYYNTAIASFEQNNEQTQYNWGLFLGQMRIMPMAKICYEKGYIDQKTVTRLEGLCRDLYKYIDMSTIVPSLLHGDLWSGNILFNMNGATLIDPAIYFGDREMELAFILMFNTFGDIFFEKYSEVHPLSQNFYEVKVPLYQIYPILVHVALYGAAYTGTLETLLKRLQV